MAKHCYIPKVFTPAHSALISTMNDIIDEYQAQGFVLTVRQLYYQLVARAVVENTLQSYKRVAGIVNDAKLAGEIDWSAIEDRTREFISKQRWDSGAQILLSAERGYHQDHWVGQDRRAFVIIEKEALIGVMQGVCFEYDMPLLAARGYPSGSVLREFAVEQIRPALRAGQDVQIYHLGDHDPSGIDMTRDIAERLTLFTNRHVEVLRLALNMAQVEELNPPENPRYGESSWELDALSPSYLADLVRHHVEELIDNDAWAAVADEVLDVKVRINAAAGTFE